MIPPAVRARLLFALRGFLWTAFLASLGLCVLKARQRQRDSRRNLVDLGIWSVVRSPEWTTAADRAQIRTTSRLPGHALPMFDRAAAAALTARLEAAPRVRRVLGLRRRLPDRLEVAIELRRPVAAVLLAGEGGGYVEVDAEGVALAPPVSERPWRSGVPLRVITGVGGPDVAPGEPFGREVEAALALSAELAQYGSEADRERLSIVDEIDVTNLGGRADRFASEVLLRAHPPDPYRPAATRCVVEWGRMPLPGDAPGGDGEAPFANKAARLSQALRFFPGFEGLVRVRVAFADLIVIPEDGTGPGTPWLPSEPALDGGR